MRARPRAPRPARRQAAAGGTEQVAEVCGIPRQRRTPPGSTASRSASTVPPSPTDDRPTRRVHDVRDRGVDATRGARAAGRGAWRRGAAVPPTTRTCRSRPSRAPPARSTSCRRSYARMYDPLIASAIAAAATSRLKGAPRSCSSRSGSRSRTAKQVATLDECLGRSRAARGRCGVERERAREPRDRRGPAVPGTARADRGDDADLDARAGVVLPERRSGSARSSRGRSPASGHGRRCCSGATVRARRSRALA